MKKGDQFTFLNLLNLDRKIVPSPERPEPALWFSELRILDQLHPLVERRRITLHRGFNILWAAPEDPEKEQGLYRDGLAGHASGKTLFCRILRYILGEEPFGTESQRNGIAGQFAVLWAAAVVRLNGRTWIVCRPLTDNGEEFATRAETIEDAFAAGVPTGSYELFRSEVKSLGKCVDPLYPPDNGWRHLLPWLARDQEARFSSLVAWRESSSQGDNPQMKVVARHQVMRAVLGLLDPKESELRKDIDAESARIEAVRESREADDTQLTGRVAQANESAIELLGEDAPKSVEEIRARLTALAEVIREGAKVLAKRPAPEGVQKAQQRLRDAELAEQTASAEIERLQNEIPAQIKKAKENLTLLAQIKFGGVTDPTRPDLGFCPRSIHEARKRGCHVDGVATDESAAAMAQLEAQAAAENIEIEKREARAKELKAKLQSLSDEVTRARNALREAEELAARDFAGLVARAARADQVNSLFEAIETNRKTLESNRQKLSERVTALESNRQKVAKLREEMDKNTNAFSLIFADIVRAVMGASVEPRITLTSDGLIPHVERKGELSGAALDTIKTLAFDLASVVASIEGKGEHPRFLIHDGPREGDMARVIYNRFFLYAASIERAFSSPEASSFQYIVTTTTPPPDSMQEGSRWLLEPVLDSRDRNRRLLKEDF